MCKLNLTQVGTFYFILLSNYKLLIMFVSKNVIGVQLKYLLETFVLIDVFCL